MRSFVLLFLIGLAQYFLGYYMGYEKAKDNICNKEKEARGE
jgi:hypothetical protein